MNDRDRDREHDGGFVRALFDLFQGGHAARDDSRGVIAARLGERDAERLRRDVEEERLRPLKLAVIGKAGVGKTTTINSLFDADWHASHAVTGTTSARRQPFTLPNGDVIEALDLPGLGDDIDTDAAYEALYREYLPAADVVLYVVQADEKSLAEDQRILRDVVLPALGDDRRIVVGLNQVDMIGPGEWDLGINYPSIEQERSIERRSADIRLKLSRVARIPRGRIVHYSAWKRYRLFEVLRALILAAGTLGWRIPVAPKSPGELMEDEEARDYFFEQMSRKAR